jgi:histidinol-phosphate/aromatic aminotransferase/cobyric acid decarboxylase-like protein
MFTTGVTEAVALVTAFSAGATTIVRSCGASSKHASTPASRLTEDDVVLASGCSGALDLAITALLNPGDNLLIPQPAFALYQTLCDSKAIGVKLHGLENDLYVISVPFGDYIDTTTGIRCATVVNLKIPLVAIYYGVYSNTLFHYYLY